MARQPRRLAGLEKNGSGPTDIANVAAFDAYVGPAREVIVDASRGIVALHDGVTPGGLKIRPEKTAATRTALKAVTGQVAGSSYFLTEFLREGEFIWRLGDYSARISADPLEGMFVKSDAVAASVGAWVRRRRMWLDPFIFGAVGDSITDDAAPLQAMVNLMMSLKWGAYIPEAGFLSSTALTHTFSPSATGPTNNKNTFGCFRIAGAGPGLSRLIFPDSDGIVLNTSSFQHTFDLTGFSLLAGSEGTRTGLKVRNTFAYFGEFNDKNNFDIDLRGSDGMGNQKFWGTAIDLFNVSKVKGRGSISGTVRAATDTNDSNYKSFGVGLRLASDPDPDSNPSTPNSTEPGYGTQYDIVMNFDLMGLSVEIGKGIQDVSFGPGTKMLIGYAGLEVLPGVTEVRQINLTGVTISGKGNGIRLRSGVSAFSLIGGYIGFAAGKNGIIFETNTGASNGAASHVKGVEFNADTAGASDAVYVNTNFNSIIIDANGYNGMNTAVELTANAGGVVIGDNSGYTNVNNKVIDGSAARANQVPAKLDFGTVTQLTSKTTAVTLNKRSGIITTNSAALAAGASASFTFNNSRYKAGDAVIVTTRNNANYSVRAGGSADGVITVTVKNETAGSLGDPVFIDFVLQPAS